jgi:hypothetical protein
VIKPGQPVVVTHCINHPDQVSWMYAANGWLGNGETGSPLCVGVNGGPTNDGTSSLMLTNCGATTTRWELSGGRFKVIGRNLCLDAQSGVDNNNPRPHAVIRQCASPAEQAVELFHHDQYWDVSPS